MKLIKKLIVAFFTVALILLPMGIVLASETGQEPPTMSVDQEDEDDGDYEEYWIFLPVEDGISYSYDQNAYDSEVSDDEYIVLSYDENDKVSITINSDREFSIVDLYDGTVFVSQRGGGTVEFNMPALDLEVVFSSAPPAEQTPGTEQQPGIDPPSIDPPSIDPPSIDPPEIDPPGIETPGTEPQGSETQGTEPQETETPGPEKNPGAEQDPGVEQEPGTGQEPSTEPPKETEKKSYKVYLREIDGVVTYMYEDSHHDKTSSDKSTLVLTYKEGETVVISIETVMTYDFINQATGKTMSVTNDNGIISFKMPASDVSILYTGINPNATPQTQTSTTPVFSSELYVYLPVEKNVTYEYSKDNYDDEESDEDYFALRYKAGDAVSFKVNYDGNVKIINFWDDKPFLTSQKSGRISFTMPSTDLELVLESDTNSTSSSSNKKNSTEKKDNSTDSSNGNSKVTLSQSSTGKSTTPSLNGISGSNKTVSKATTKTSTASLGTNSLTSTSGNKTSATTFSQLGLDSLELDVGEGVPLSESALGMSDTEALENVTDAMEDGNSEGMTEDSTENEPESNTEAGTEEETENSTNDVDVEETELETETDNTAASEGTDRNQDGDSYTDGTDNTEKNVNLKISFDIEPMVGIFVIAALSIQVILLAIFLLAIIVIISNRK